MRSGKIIIRAGNRTIKKREKRGFNENCMGKNKVELKKGEGHKRLQIKETRVKCITKGVIWD